MVFTSRVLARPGTPTSRQCPLLKIEMSTFLIVSSCPTITFPISAFSCLYRETNPSIASVSFLKFIADKDNNYMVNTPSLHRKPRACGSSCKNNRAARSGFPALFLFCRWQSLRSPPLWQCSPPLWSDSQKPPTIAPHHSSAWSFCTHRGCPAHSGFFPPLTLC